MGAAASGFALPRQLSSSVAVDYFRARSAQADTKQQPALGIADIDAVIVGITFNGERCHEELALRFGTLERGAIVRELDPIVIAYTVGPEIPVEIIARHGQAFRCKKNGRRERPS